MSEPSLEERVAALEKTVAQILAESSDPGVKKDWHAVIGMFEDDPGMRAIDDEGRRIRDEDRRQESR